MWVDVAANKKVGLEMQVYVRNILNFTYFSSDLWDIMCPYKPAPSSFWD